MALSSEGNGTMVMRRAEDSGREGWWHFREGGESELCFHQFGARGAG